MDNKRLQEATNAARILLDAREYIKDTPDTYITLLLAEAIEHLKVRTEHDGSN